MEPISKNHLRVSPAAQYASAAATMFDGQQVLSIASCIDE
jgi:hypothetical protein